jgi:hypothetical protein
LLGNSRDRQHRLRFKQNSAVEELCTSATYELFKDTPSAAVDEASRLIACPHASWTQLRRVEFTVAESLARSSPSCWDAIRRRLPLWPRGVSALRLMAIDARVSDVLAVLVATAPFVRGLTELSLSFRQLRWYPPTGHASARLGRGMALAERELQLEAVTGELRALERRARAFPALRTLSLGFGDLGNEGHRPELLRAFLAPLPAVRRALPALATVTLRLPAGNCGGAGGEVKGELCEQLRRRYPFLTIEFVASP